MLSDLAQPTTTLANENQMMGLLKSDCLMTKFMSAIGTSLPEHLVCCTD